MGPPHRTWVKSLFHLEVQLGWEVSFFLKKLMTCGIYSNSVLYSGILQWLYICKWFLVRYMLLETHRLDGFATFMVRAVDSHLS